MYNGQLHPLENLHVLQTGCQMEDMFPFPDTLRLRKDPLVMSTINVNYSKI